MKRRAALMACVAIAVAIGMYFVIRPVTAPDATKHVADRRFLLVVQQKKLLSGPTTLQVDKGDRVEIQVESDAAEELHLHGYNLMVELEPNVTAHLDFVADRSGRFEYELERSGQEMGILEVAPR